jgi:hypothetical protein
VAAAEDDLFSAERHFLSAMAGRLRTSNDRAVVALCLGELAWNRGDGETAAEFLFQAKSEPHGADTDGLIQKLEALMKGGEGSC